MTIILHSVFQFVSVCWEYFPGAEQEVIVTRHQHIQDSSERYKTIKRYKNEIKITSSWQEEQTRWWKLIQYHNLHYTRWRYSIIWTSYGQFTKVKAPQNASIIWVNDGLVHISQNSSQSSSMILSHHLSNYGPTSTGPQWKIVVVLLTLKSHPTIGNSQC